MLDAYQLWPGSIRVSIAIAVIVLLAVSGVYYCQAMSPSRRYLWLTRTNEERGSAGGSLTNTLQCCAVAVSTARRCDPL
jgi:hypothetical protein